MMCGISGYYSHADAIGATTEIEAMTRVLQHRGPDDEGITLIDPESGGAQDVSTSDTAAGVEIFARAQPGASLRHRIALGHRRFAIVDLSPSGHQPFWSCDRRVCVSFNGEIYNYLELRAQLENLGHVFRTHSDTEVLAEAYLEWGTEAFSRFCGFWALALYDTQRRQLLLARDRIGKAALYVSRLRGRLWWSSEIAGLVAGLGERTLTVRETAVANFVVHSWRDDQDRTFYAEVDTFPSGSFAWVRPDGSYLPKRYWSLPAQRLREDEITEDEAADELRARLGEALRLRLRADVPVGIELSGGMDSSALLAIAASNGHDLKAFTIGFPDAEADEEPYARMVWERYKDRVDLTVSDMRVEKLFHGGDSADGALAAVDGMGEPFHSPSMLANQQIWRDMRRRGIRVSINGGAGDELLAGYSGVHFQPYLWDLLRSGRFGRYHREAVSCSEAPTAAFSQAYFGRLLRVARFGLQTSFLHQAASNARAAQRAIDAGLDPGMAPDLRRPLPLERLLVEQMGDRQMNYWLRSGHQSHMSIPIEVRAPFLDHRVVEHAFLLPTRYLIRDGWLKWILRHATRDLLPAEILWRANKAGFPFPFASWLRDSKRPFLAIAKGSGAASIAGIDLCKLEARYDELIQVDPHMLWRLMSVCLWWQRCARASTASNECS